MEKDKFYALPELPYKYKELEPHISEEQLKIHHVKHHQAYVEKANDIMEKIDKARIEKNELDFKAVAKELSFNIGGHILHSLFWKNLSPKPGERSKAFAEALQKEFGSFERFKSEFSAAAAVEGSGWAILALDKATGRLVILQAEKHNVNVCLGLKPLLVLDVWEHAYYLDYKNDKAKFIEAFWSIVNWEEVSRRFEEAF